MREQFEKLPEIARVVACDEVKWCDTYHWYRTDNTDANSIYHVAWLNGAWYAFQERQKEIDKINSFNQCAENQIGDSCSRWSSLNEDKQKKIDAALAEIERLQSATGLNCINKIRDILK